MPVIYIGLLRFDIKTYLPPRYRQDRIIMGNSGLEEGVAESNHPLELKVLFYVAFAVSFPLTVLGKFLFTTILLS